MGPGYKGLDCKKVKEDCMELAYMGRDYRALGCTRTSLEEENTWREHLEESMKTWQEV
jgi:hypothetical protein